MNIYGHVTEVYSIVILLDLDVAVELSPHKKNFLDSNSNSILCKCGTFGMNCCLSLQACPALNW